MSMEATTQKPILDLLETIVVSLGERMSSSDGVTANTNCSRLNTETYVQSAYRWCSVWDAQLTMKK
jgi:hypothetical protein